jgi:hypothetical protein
MCDRSSGRESTQWSMSPAMTVCVTILIRTRQLLLLASTVNVSAPHIDVLPTSAPRRAEAFLPMSLVCAVTCKAYRNRKLLPPDQTFLSSVSPSSLSLRIPIIQPFSGGGLVFVIDQHQSNHHEALQPPREHRLKRTPRLALVAVSASRFSCMG